jgi:hypothetical protein
MSPLLVRSRLFSYLLLSVALAQRSLRPRAKAASNSRCRWCHSRSSVCIGDLRNEKRRILCYPLLAWMNLLCTVPSQYSPLMRKALLEVQDIELNFNVTPIYSSSTYTCDLRAAASISNTTSSTTASK